jgi:hypothetical protein
MPKRVPKPMARILSGLKTAAKPDNQFPKAKTSILGLLKKCLKCTY